MSKLDLSTLDLAELVKLYEVEENDRKAETIRQTGIRRFGINAWEDATR